MQLDIGFADILLGTIRQNLGLGHPSLRRFTATGPSASHDTSSNEQPASLRQPSAKVVEWERAAA